MFILFLEIFDFFGIFDSNSSNVKVAIPKSSGNAGGKTKTITNFKILVKNVEKIRENTRCRKITKKK
jgi:hypothetical protein